MDNWKAAAAVAILFFQITTFADVEIVHHPITKKPLYLDTSTYEKIKKELPALPSLTSAEQKSDEAELRRWQKERTSSDCDRAKAEAKVSLNAFYGPNKKNSTLSAKQVEILNAFFEQTRNDADYFIQNMKKDFTRKRPFMYMNGLKPCVPQEVTGAYPSGHATLAKLWALILSDFFPAGAATFEARSVEIGKNRVLSGMHHPTDIEAGRTLAKFVYAELKKSKSFQSAFADMSSKLGSVKTQADKAKLEATK